MNRMKYLSLCIFIVMMLTACAKNFNFSIGNQSLNENFTTKEEPIDLYSTYDQNDLIIGTLEEEYSGVEAEIPQIEGLKDTSVQKKINQDMRGRVRAAYKEVPQLQYVTFNTMANFSNVISIGVYIGGEAEDSHVQVYLNYNLVNGNRLTFEELFLSNTDTLEIIRDAFRETLIKNWLSGDYNENELYKMVKNYSEDEEKEFAFTPSHLILYYNDFGASVKMLDIAEEVAIYSRYVTKDSLYKTDDIGRKDIFTCVEIPEGAFDICEFGYLNDNLWYDFSVFEDYYGDEIEGADLEKYTAFKEKIYAEIYEQIEEYREVAKENPERVYIILAKPSISAEIDSEWVSGEWEESYTGKAFVSKNVQIFEMTRETFDNVYNQKLIDSYRYEYFTMRGGVYLEAEGDVVLKEEADASYYNYITGELLSYE